MDIIDKAKDLGRSIAASDEMHRLKKAEVALESDDKAKQLMNDYKRLQIEVVRASKEKKDKSEIEEIKEKLMEKQKEINEYAVTNEYLISKSEFDNFVKTINDVIIFSISGEEPCNPKKCTSCAGGCSN